MKLKSFVFLFLVLLLGGVFTGCGYSSRGNEIVIQPKGLHNVTPILCPDRVDLDASLGVMRNGVGSMSAQDLMLRVTDGSQAKAIQAAISSGKLLRVKYSELRWAVCGDGLLVDSVELADPEDDGGVLIIE